jgi:hypothetical protein
LVTNYFDQFSSDSTDEGIESQFLIRNLNKILFKKQSKARDNNETSTDIQPKFKMTQNDIERNVLLVSDPFNDNIINLSEFIILLLLLFSSRNNFLSRLYSFVNYKLITTRGKNSNNLLHLTIQEAKHLENFLGLFYNKQTDIYQTTTKSIVSSMQNSDQAEIEVKKFVNQMDNSFKNYLFIEWLE